MKCRGIAFLLVLLAVVLAPLAAQAQQASMPRVGFLAAGSAATTRDWIEAFGHRLDELGWIRGA
jgi:hypothetical protein